MTIEIQLDTVSFFRSLGLTAAEMDRAAARAINKTIFEMRDAEAARVGSVFKFAGEATKGFLTRTSGSGQAFRFSLATPERLEASLFPAPKAGKLLAPHERGAQRTGGEPGQFTIEGQLATPIAPGAQTGRSPGVLRKTSRGFLRKRAKGHSFIRGKAVLERIGTGKRSRLRVLFALTKSAKLEPRFDFYRVARDTARRVFPEKMRREMAKIRGTR